MTTKEKIELMNWCMDAIVALRMADAAIQLEQLKLLPINGKIFNHDVFKVFLTPKNS